MSRSEFKTRPWAKQYRIAMDKGLEYCRSCFAREKLTFGHIVAWALGGSNSMSNMTILCQDCNNRDGMDTFEYAPLKQDEDYYKFPAQLKENDQTMYGIVKQCKQHKHMVFVEFKNHTIVREFLSDYRIAVFS